jgi:predicted RNA binding protein YcfA (HicA-like mRNA interferase family)
MSKVKKQIARMRVNPRDWRIEDIKAIADRVGLDHRQPGTSHVTFRSDSGLKLTVPAHKPIKPIYIKKFLELIDDLGVKL